MSKWGTLQIKVIKARSLAKMDTFGLSDPFAVLKVGGVTKKTRVIPKSLNPIWDEEFAFDLPTKNTELVLNLFDKDKFFRNEFMGTVTLRLDKYKPGEYAEKWHKLEKRKARSSVQGDIFLGVLVTRERTPEELAAINKKKQDSKQRLLEKKREQAARWGIDINAGPGEPNEGETPGGPGPEEMEEPPVIPAAKEANVGGEPNARQARSQLWQPGQPRAAQQPPPAAAGFDDEAPPQPLRRRGHRKGKEPPPGRHPMLSSGHYAIPVDVAEDENAGPQRIDSELLDVQVECIRCRVRRPLEDVFSLACNHDVCGHCFGPHIKTLLAKKAEVAECPVETCRANLPEWLMKRFVTEEEFDAWERANVERMLEATGGYFRCANADCKILMERMPYDPKTAVLDKSLKDMHGKPMTEAALHHRNEFRMRCRSCDTIFCSDCTAKPYHNGYDCAGYDKYLKSRQCRFCSASLSEKNMAPAPEGWAEDEPIPSTLADCCNEEECLEYRANCCEVVLPCGHYCVGVKGEEKHIGCMKEDCEHNNGIDGDDWCNICWSAELAAAPSIQLECGHTFHHHCAKTKLAGKWDGPRITFTYAECPLCKKFMKHPSLAPLLKSHDELYDIVKAKACQRLEYEGEGQNPEIVLESGRFHKDPGGYALSIFSYFLCFKCKKPYFGGRKVCDDGRGNDFNPADLVCANCSGAAAEAKCSKHGEEFIQYKCKFCCSIANWFCWGNTHFCDPCHTIQVKGTYLNRKSKSEFPVCAGSAQCPLGVAHPHVEEFCLGCTSHRCKLQYCLGREKELESWHDQASSEALQLAAVDAPI